MICPSEINNLVLRFKENLPSYSASNYNEAQLRQEFLNPFFEALGWDVSNKQGFAEAYKEVIHEDAVKVGGVTKAPDYSFRIGGIRKFFVEAKKPFVSIKDDGGPAFQLRRYAWSGKLPLSILTNFEEFAVYDCRFKPDKNDKSSVGRILYLRYEEYAARWDEIAAVFSKDSIQKGSYDKYAATAKGKKGTSEVDAAFLSEIENWRNLLAHNIALKNPELSQRELNFATQRTIDRIIFLRICEDRGVEHYGTLMALLNGVDVYKRMRHNFQKADEIYNSGLFHFRDEKGRAEPPDTLTLSLQIDDKPLKELITNLYYPESPYEFSVLPADILGQVYEQFLGKVIRLTAGHQAKVEDKPEVKKAGGVFYTPTYIVDYIVKNTVGVLIENQTPKQMEKIKILDPACGSGSFLIQAYQFLLDYHRDWYIKDGADKHSKGKYPVLTKVNSGEWRLSTSERKKILLNNIHGVDIDSQAVEVTKLSLLLKVLEGENEQSLAHQMTLWHERALPDLENNIKCGNSLIGSDFYNGVQEALPLYEEAEEERYKINVFDWDDENGFPEIMKNGGFDAVIANPPYVRQETLGEKFKEYASSHYKTYAGTADLYVYFFEKAHKLLKSEGFFGMICSNKFMRANYGKPLREFLANETALVQIIDFGELPVFANAATFPAIYLTRNQKMKFQKFIYAAIKRLDFESLEEEVKAVGTKLDRKSLSGDNWTLASKGEVEIIEKIKKVGIPLKDYSGVQIYRGILTGFNEAFVIDGETRKRLIKEDPKSKEIIKPFVVGDDVRKFKINFKDRFLIFTRHGIAINEYPAIYNHLLSFKSKLTPRPKNWKGKEWLGRKPGAYDWYEIQDTIDYYQEFEKPKILYPVIGKESRFSFDKDGYYSNDKTFFIPTDDLYLLGILNSKISWIFFKRLCSVLGDPDNGGRLELRSIHVCQLPVKNIDFEKPFEKSRHDKIIDLVTAILSLHQKLPLARTDHEKTLLQRQIDSTDRNIDKLVYELYGLTEEEIAVVEGKPDPGY